MAEQKLRQKLTDITLTEIVTDTGCDRFSEEIPEEGKSPRAYGVYLVSGSICECTILVPEVLQINDASKKGDYTGPMQSDKIEKLLCGTVSIEGRCTKQLTLTASAHQIDMISQNDQSCRKADIIFPGITFPATENGKRTKVSGEIYAVWKDCAPQEGKWKGNVSYDMLVEPRCVAKFDKSRMELQK